MGKEDIKPFAFKPGQSGNPGGRPRSRIITSELTQILEGNQLAGVKIPEGKTVAHVLAGSIIINAMKGNGHAIKAVLERIEGMVIAETNEDDRSIVDLGELYQTIIQHARDLDEQAKVEAKPKRKQA